MEALTITMGDKVASMVPNATGGVDIEVKGPAGRATGAIVNPDNIGIVRQLFREWDKREGVYNCPPKPEPAPAPIVVPQPIQYEPQPQFVWPSFPTVQPQWTACAGCSKKTVEVENL